MMTEIPIVSPVIRPGHRARVTHLGRDPFARGEYHRTTTGYEGSCAWCGRNARTLYRYGWESDGIATCPPRLLPRDFCSFPCFEAFAS